ncbi:uncharacterized protein LOC141734394 isoform X1 [Larus michahellis]|uniref:uncharacterized protein LOC141734394 isoform X1 n=1 Tax=Larus michahellis TaxID=119627 RepID=UPI003D9B4358
MCIQGELNQKKLSCLNVQVKQGTGAGAISREDERGNLLAERGCCRRQSHFLHVRYVLCFTGVSGSPVCRKCWSSCLAQQISAGFLGLSRHSSVLDFLRSKKCTCHLPCSAQLQVRHPNSPLQLAAPRSCPAGSCCELSRLHVERLLLLEGLREVEVVDGCHCSTWPEECLRLPALNTFPDSPWEVTVDMGKCSDLTYSADGLFCMSTKFNTALVKTPQGGEVVWMLENCEMKEKGYRVSQEIDAGRCLGSCSSGDPCLLRSCLRPLHPSLVRHPHLQEPPGARSHRRCHPAAQVQGVAGQGTCRWGSGQTPLPDCL